jgi:hypothetical protein
VIFGAYPEAGPANRLLASWNRNCKGLVIGPATKGRVYISLREGARRERQIDNVAPFGTVTGDVGVVTNWVKKL